MQAAQSTFISSTNWTERVGLVAALATIRKHRRENVASHLMMIGNMVKMGWQKTAEHVGLQLKADGLPSLAHFQLIHEDALRLTTLFSQQMLEKGFLASDQFKPSFAHAPDHVAEYLEAVSDTFLVLAESLAWGDIDRRLNGPPAQKGFYRLT